MPIIDAQVHCYERNHPGRPWHAVLAGPPEVTGPDMVKAMDEVGVDGALLVSVYTMYRWDASYAVGGAEGASRPVRRDQAGQRQRSQGAGRDRRVGGHAGHGRDPHHDDAGDLDRRGRSRHQPHPRRRGQARPAGQHAGARPARAARRARQAQPEHADRDRSPGPRAAVRAAGATGAVEGAAARAQGRGEQERRHQDQRRLHAQPREVPLQGHLGSARPASSTPTVSTAACGAPTGRAR